MIALAVAYALILGLWTCRMRATGDMPPPASTLAPLEAPDTTFSDGGQP